MFVDTSIQSVRPRLTLARVGVPVLALAILVAALIAWLWNDNGGEPQATLEPTASVSDSTRSSATAVSADNVGVAVVPAPTTAPGTSVDPASAVPQAETITHAVVAGDTLTAIAETYGVSVDTIIQENKLTSTLIDVGQVLDIPGTASLPSAP